MFKDYYAILEIPSSATFEEIKVAYHKQALKWHPDRNLGQNTEMQMKDINEAYEILRNTESRNRYDSEYALFKSFKAQKVKSDKSSNINTDNKDQTESDSKENYDIHDEDLKEDIKRAKKTAEDFVKEFYKNLKEDSKTAAQGAWKAAKPFVIFALVSIGITFVLSLIAIGL